MSTLKTRHVSISTFRTLDRIKQDCEASSAGARLNMPVNMGTIHLTQTINHIINMSNL